jgi:hypothetical protein
MQELYSHLACPGSLLLKSQQLPNSSIVQEEVFPVEKDDGNYTITFRLLNEITYVGIKAVNSKGKEVFYKPIEVSTLWGHLSRSTRSHQASIGFLLCLVVLGIVVCVRRSARKGYRQIEQEG